MPQPRSPRRTRSALLLVAVVLAGLVVPGLGRARPAAAVAPAVADAVDELRAARDRTVELRAELDAEQARRDEVASRRVRASEAAVTAERDLAAERSRYGTMSAEFFVRHGADDAAANESMRLAMSGLRDRLRAAVEHQELAAEALASAQSDQASADEALAAVEQRHADAVSATDEASERADAALADAGAPDLPGIAYIAYIDAARAAAPSCRLPAAVIAGLGRISSEHGRSAGAGPDADGRVEPVLRGLRGERGPDTDGGELDGDTGGDSAVGPMQLAPSVWSTSGVDGDGDGRADPDDLFDAAATVSALLCSGGAPLDGYDAMQGAVEGLLGQQQEAMVVLGTARRYAQADLDMGEVPPNPRGLGFDADPQFDVSDTNFAPGDVLSMIDWAYSRVGTPYSQCLGPLARPQDPVCPPGTNRFGQGFFDCSGFVSSAYRRIGLSVPATTYAMEASSWFMSSRVADRFDLSVMRPGDVFLMNGHTGMYVGGGKIIHAISRGLTAEPVPRWVANGTFAVLRPSDLFGRPAPPPGSEPIAPRDVLDDLRAVVAAPTPGLPDLSALLPLLSPPPEAAPPAEPAPTDPAAAPPAPPPGPAPAPTTTAPRPTTTSTTVPAGPPAG